MVAGPVFTLALLCSGCVRGESLVGTWTSAEQGETIEFRSDGGGALVTAGGVVVPLTWEASGAELVLGVQGGGTKTVAYSLKGGVLTLTSYGEEPAIYTRVETTER
jgi:hypothetical protein